MSELLGHGYSIIKRTRVVPRVEMRLKCGGVSLWAIGFEKTENGKGFGDMKKISRLVVVVMLVLLVSVALAQKGPLAYYQKAKINWKAFEGTQVTIGLNKHPFTESLRLLLPIFEQLTGIKVAYVILSEEEFFEKLLIDLSSGSGIFDVYMTLPMFKWQYQYTGWIEDLNPYWNNLERRDQAWYSRDDFYEKPLRANMWDETIAGTGAMEWYSGHG